MPALEQLEAAFLDAQDDPSFAAELSGLLAKLRRPADAADPLPQPSRQHLSEARGPAPRRRAQDQPGACPGLLAKRMGKTRLIAETGAGQHGVATAIVGALSGFETVIYMGAEDVERQELNVFRMELMGATRRAGRERRADAQGCDQRSAARLVGELRDHPLSARHGGRAASLSDDGARIPAGDRQGGARADHRADRAPARCGGRLRRRRVERDRAVHRFPRGRRRG